jgi:hypothetical protein
VDEPSKLTQVAITELLNLPASAPLATLYIPTHRGASPPNMNEDQIRCKNLVHKARNILKNRDDGQPLTHALEKCLERLLGGRNFWEHQTEGLLLCVSEQQCLCYHLPIDTEEYVAVDNRFHLAPVLGLLAGLPNYYVLVVAQHEPALFMGDSYDVYDTGISLPATLAEGLNLDEVHHKAEQQRSANEGGGYNGRGADKDPAEDDRLRFWRLLDHIVCSKADTSLPLILAGTGSELVEYRKITHYPHILETSEPGSFGGFKPHELFAAASDVLRRECILPAEAATVERYKRAKGQAPDQVVQTMAAIKDAAEAGRVETLLLAAVRSTSDTVRDSGDHLPVLTFPPEKSAETVETIAYNVWKNGGTIAIISVNAMPEAGASLLAILRY